MLLLIEVESNTPFFFGLWLDSPDLELERLKAIVENYQTMDIQSLYDTVRNINTKKNKTPTSHVTTSSALYASVTPLTVQAQQQPMQQTVSSSTTSTAEEADTIAITKEDEVHTPPTVHRGSPAQGALTAVYNASKKNKSLPSLKNTEPSAPTSKEEWPSHITQPKEKVDCDCADHLDKVEQDIVLPIGAKHLYDFMYDTKIWKRLNQVKTYSEPTFTEWKENDDGHLERTVNYVMPVSSPMVKAKETDVIETQQVLKRKDYLSYTILVMTKTPNLPYADAFIPCIKYCITYETASSCRLVCSMGIKWIKTIFVKGMINKAATKGMSETIQGILPILQDEISNNTGITDKHQPAKEQIKKPDALHVPPKDELKKKKGYLNLFTVILGSIYVLFMAYQVYLSRRCELLLHQSENDGISMVWRGVYLRDIQDKVTDNRAVLDHVEPVVYSLFQEARTNGTTQQWKHAWFDKLHRNMAQELGYSRERLGAIRYELLSTFRMLNRVEYQLLEIEYWNWLSDQKLMCLNQDNKLAICEVLNKERDL